MLGHRKEFSYLIDARRPRKSITPLNILQLQNLIHDYERVTVSKRIALTTVSNESVQTIIKKELKLRITSAPWVQKILKKVRGKIFQRDLNSFTAKGDSYLMRILTRDESWVHHYSCETKRSCMKSREIDETTPVEAKTHLSAGRVSQSSIVTLNVLCK